MESLLADFDWLTKIRSGKVLLNVNIKGIVVNYKEEQPKEPTFISSHDSGRYLLGSKDGIKPLYDFLRLKVNKSRMKSHFFVSFQKREMNGIVFDMKLMGPN